MNWSKLFFIFLFIAIFFSFFTIKANAQCDINCGDCTIQTTCAESLALPDGCEWNPGSLLPPVPAQCQVCSRPTEVFWPDSPFGTHLGGCSTLVVLVKYVYEWGISLGGLTAFIAFVIGGVLYLTSAGDPGKMREGKDRIFTAITGLVLLFSIFLILNTINPELTLLTIPSSGMGAPCDINTDCCINPANCPFTCDDTNQGDGKQEGYCLLSILSGCDTVADCLPTPCDIDTDCSMGSTCLGDPTPGDGNRDGLCSTTYQCKNDPYPGNGTKEGLCFPVCKNVTLYSDTNYGTAIATYTPADGCKPVATVESAKIDGGCSVSLYVDTTDCNAADATGKSIILSGSVADIATNYAVSTTFQSVQVKDASF